LGLVYIKVLKEKDKIKRLKLKAKVETIERTLANMEQKMTFTQYVVDTDQKYRDRVFWITENSKNETQESVKSWTLMERVEIEKRLIQKIDEEARRSRGGDTEP